jgi:hypothetical protein
VSFLSSAFSAPHRIKHCFHPCSWASGDIVKVLPNERKETEVCQIKRCDMLQDALTLDAQDFRT